MYKEQLVRELTLATLACVAILSAQEKRLSPHETVNLSLGGQQITISYGRPYIHGRKIMGDLVPYGEVWRTGADEATILTTPVTLSIAGINLPAGKYSLWTLPSAGTWKLIINKQTGQWGTNYDGAQDLARVDMKKSTLPHPVDQFTISYRKNGERAATLLLEWENTSVSVPVLSQ